VITKDGAEHRQNHLGKSLAEFFTMYTVTLGRPCAAIKEIALCRNSLMFSFSALALPEAALRPRWPRTESK
jgi:hypothetical protein